MVAWLTCHGWQLPGSFYGGSLGVFLFIGTSCEWVAHIRQQQGLLHVRGAAFALVGIFIVMQVAMSKAPIRALAHATSPRVLLSQRWQESGEGTLASLIAVLVQAVGGQYEACDMKQLGQHACRV